MFNPNRAKPTSDNDELFEGLSDEEILAGVDAELAQATERPQSQALGRKVNRILERHQQKYAPRESLAHLSMAEQLSHQFASAEAIEVQEQNDAETFDKIVAHTLTFTQIDYKPDEALFELAYRTPADDDHFLDLISSAVSHYLMRQWLNHRDEEDLETSKDTKAVQFLKDRLLTNGYSYYFYNSADSDSLREYGLSPNLRPYGYSEAIEVDEILLKYQGGYAALDGLFSDQKTDDLEFQSSPQNAYLQACNYPSWFANFVDGGRKDSEQQSPFATRNYDQARAQVEQYCDSLSRIDYGDEAKDRIMSASGMSAEDRDKVMTFFDKMWQHYGEGAPAVALIPNSELDLSHYEQLIDQRLADLGDSAPLKDKLKAVLNAYYEGTTNLTTDQIILPEDIQLVQLPKPHAVVKEEITPEDTASIGVSTLREIIYDDHDALKQLRELGPQVLSQIHGIDQIDRRAILDPRITELRDNYYYNRCSSAFKKQSEEATVEGFREYYTRYFSILDQLDLVKSPDYFSLHGDGRKNSQAFREALASSLVEEDEVPPQTIARLNRIFSYTNTIPNVVQEFLSAEILHPPEDYLEAFAIKQNFTNFHHHSAYSYHLSKAYNQRKGEGVRRVVYNDLLKCALGSNGQNLLDFLKTAEQGEQVMADIAQGRTTVSPVDEDFVTLGLFNSILEGVWQQSAHSKDEEAPALWRHNDLAKFLYNKFPPTNQLSITDRITRIYCWPAGIKSADDLRQRIEDTRYQADTNGRMMAQSIRHHNRANQIQEGDFIKAVPNADSLHSILENGILSKEYTITGTVSDATPYDTDFSLVTQPGDLRTALTHTNGAKLTSLRDKYHTASALFLVIEQDQLADESIWPYGKDYERPNKYQPDKYEIVRRDEYIAGDEDYEMLGISPDDEIPDVGIRTGVPSSKISYIVATDGEAARKAQRAVADNDFYVPIVNLDGELIFSPEDYDERRKRHG